MLLGFGLQFGNRMSAIYREICIVYEYIFISTVGDRSSRVSQVHSGAVRVQCMQQYVVYHIPSCGGSPTSLSRSEVPVS